MGRKRGFTLIELLVVIAIIAILAAILFPVFAQAREKARASACLSNQKQIATGMMLYADDYDEALVQTIYDKPKGGNPALRLWTTHLQPYLKSGGGTFPASGVFACPSWSQDRLIAAGQSPNCDDIAAAFVVNPQIYSHYGMANAQAVRLGSGTQTDPYVHTPGGGYTPPVGTVTVYLSQVLRPSDSAVISDGVTVSFGTKNSILSAYGCVGMKMHQEGCNYVFLDGHAKYLKGNPEDAVLQNGQGEWFMKYFTYDME